MNVYKEPNSKNIDNNLIRVFIFEDHWVWKEAFDSVLIKEKGINLVGISETVQEGIMEVLKIKPDVILMDLLFKEGMLGVGAASEIKAKLPETKIIIFTENPDKNSLLGAVEAKVSGFLLKDELKEQDPDTIIQAIKTVHYGDAYITPSMAARILKIFQPLVKRCNFDLTKRELQILKFISVGKGNKEIATALQIKARTVANHINNILFKMTAKNRTEAAAIARNSGLID